MSANRTRTADLVRLLNAAEQPIYVLDEDFSIVFVNQACRQWLGEAAVEAILGQKCVYRSTADASDAGAAARLCPPPQVLAGETLAATVSRLAEDGTLSHRRARFLPLGLEKGEIFAIVAIVEPSERQPEAEESFTADIGEADPLALHAQIRRFRLEAAGRYGLDRLIGRGPAVALARRQAALAIAGQANVVLVGPPGSGRRHLAAAIHYGASQTAAGSLSGELLPLDCSLLGNDLLDAAASALARGIQRSEPAASRTLLFHRIDELSAEMQTRLMEYFSGRTHGSRLAATSTEPLVELARRGKFHAELAALLSTVTIVLPPLFERREDLPLLAQLFLEEWNAAESRQLGGFSPAALDRLDAYAWPGNVAELAEVVAEACRRAAGPIIEVGDLPERLHLAAQAAAHPRRAEETIVLDEYLARVERELIRRALARAKGNKARAARLLGVTRPRLYRRMVQLGLES